MTLRMWVIVAAILASVLAAMSGCATDSGSIAELTVALTPEPAAVPTAESTETPTPEPAAVPTAESTETPTPEPTAPSPAAEPTKTPTPEPTTPPTTEPTETPSPKPPEMPSAEPTKKAPTAASTEAPTPEPTLAPTAEPTATPTPEPATAPTPRPTAPPTLSPAEWDTKIYGHRSRPTPPGDCDSLEDESAIQTVEVGKVQWSPDGSQILFTDSGKEHGPPADAVEADGSKLWRIKDASGYLFSGYAGAIRNFDISADGSRIVYSTCAYSELDDDYEIAVSNIDGTDTARLTENSESELYPVWSADGTRLAFIRRAELTIYTVATSDWTSVTINVAPIPPAWSPDGRTIAFLAYATRPQLYDHNWSDLRQAARVHVYTVGADGSGLKQVVPNAVSVPSWSPDGERIAVAVSEGDEATLQTFAADGSDPAMVASVGTKDIIDRRGRAAHPAALWVPNVSWSPDGSEIMYGALSVVNPYDKSVILDRQLNVAGEIFGEAKASLRPLAAWSPDGSRIAVLLGNSFLYTMNSDGTDLRRLVGVGEDGVTTALMPVRPPADVEACSRGVVVPDPDENTELVEDCRTLLGMRDKFAGFGETLPWRSDTPIGRWDGVTVSGNPLRVRGLYISEFLIQGGLYGQIPPEISNLEGLRELKIEWSHINGRIPREIGRLENLESLEVIYTLVGGSIPAEIGNLVNLESLVLQNSLLSGHIPPEIGNLRKLRVLDLRVSDPRIQGGRFTGPIPPELGNMVSLEELLLGGNRLGGNIPAELGELNNLISLSLFGNELTGCIPQTLGDLRLSDLDWLELEYCE